MKNPRVGRKTPNKQTKKHDSIRWLFKFKNLDSQLVRWLETLRTCKFQTEHRPGMQHINICNLAEYSANNVVWAPKKIGEEENITDKPEVKSATSVIVIKLNAENDNMCLKVNEMQSEDNDLRHIIAWFDSKQIFI